MPQIHKMFCGLAWFDDNNDRHQCIVLDSSPDGDSHSEHECKCGAKLDRR